MPRELIMIKRRKKEEEFQERSKFKEWKDSIILVQAWSHNFAPLHYLNLADLIIRDD